ncbi:GntR family transcriptional regulator [Erysipelotrichaceae bacterium RD49]|nr:GntR family transcriptional regulator [Erysipelotrichaceae bacterium RD49]
MNLQISSSSMTPVYEQITTQIRRQIQDGTLAEGEQLPSVRAVARDYHISALTVKKAYDQLDAEGLVTTVHGKGSYVNAIDAEFSKEQARRQIEEELTKTIAKARLMDISSQEIKDMVDLLLEDSK